MADYIDRSAAIEALDDYVEMCRGTDGYEMIYRAARIANTIISKLPSPWVKAEERPPEKSGEYLCAFNYAPEGKIFIDKIEYCAEGRHKGFDDWCGQRVSRWMQMPDAPEVERC